MLRTLIVDDEYWVRFGMRETLAWEELGFSIVGEAKDGKEGFKRFLELRPDIVITDICMENGDGLELIKNIRSTASHADIIILSGYKEFEYAQKAIEYGVNSYLLKPIKNEDLTNALLSIKKLRNDTEENDEETEKTEDSQVISFSHNDIKKVASSIRKVDYESTLSIINQYFEKIDRSKNVNISVLQTNILEFVILIIHSVFENKKGSEELFGKNFQPAREIHQLKTLEEIQNWIVQFINKIYENPNAFLNYTYQPEIQQAIAIIMFRYQEPLTVSDVASELLMSSSYLMYLFKKETGKTFNTFLTEYRINTAIELIKTGKYKIYEISELVGYKNPAYFIKLFKRFTGKTPKYFSNARNFEDEE